MSCRDVKVTTEGEWRAEHEPHGAFEEVLRDNQPPEGAGYKLWDIRCPCGAKMIISRSVGDKRGAR
jgi:hypothetical protein